MLASISAYRYAVNLTVRVAPLLLAMSLPSAAAPRAQDRVLGLQGAPNFRDIGGYTTADGRHVRWGLVYRSNKLSALTPADESRVTALHIATEIDLRTIQERADEPDRWLQPPADIYQSPKPSLKPLIGQLLAGVHDVPTARQSMERFYARMPDEYRPEYTALFQRLAAGDAPILVHCTAGKDRTGVATAILLTALGVPRETVVSDYGMSEKLLPPPSIKAGALSQLPPDAQRELMRSDPVFIQAALDSIDHEYGSVGGYLKNGLGLNSAQIDAMRSRLTQ